MKIRIISVLALTIVFNTCPAWAKKMSVKDDGASEVTLPRAALNGNDLRRMRRMGGGIMAAGPLGLGGVYLELNFTPQSGLLAGFGGGPGYQAYTVQYKRTLSGDWLLPYMSFGFARWANFEKKGPIKETTPGLLAERFMSDDDKATGTISESFIYPALGLQYLQLDGRWAGFSAFIELVLLIDLGQFAAAPTGTVGIGYYF